jgi:DNA-binding MarR family transcriptional regulator
VPLITNEAGDSELSCTHTSLRRAARHLTQIYDDVLAPSGLTSSQSLIVSLIDEMGGQPGGEGPSLKQLARRMGLQVSALSHAFRPMVREGIVELKADLTDARVKRAVLTPKGLSQTRQMYSLWKTLTERMEDALGKSANDQLRELTDKVLAVDPRSFTP